MEPTGRVLVVGAGGLGCPALWALAAAPGVRLLIVDEDEVDGSNLHRQLLYDDEDVGTDKVEAIRRALLARGVAPERLELRRDRFLPENAVELARSVDVIVEGSDNFATKFLAADVAHLAERPIVHGAAVRWQATAWAVAPAGAPCYRCFFEDLPGEAPNCADAGVMGPVVGFAGAVMAELALRVLAGDAPYGTLYAIDGLKGTARAVPVHRRSTCNLCGVSPTILDVNEERYWGPTCSSLHL